MTGLTSEQFGIVDRGHISEGGYADLVVFDAESVADRATFASPTLRPVGIEHVMVNGTSVFQDGAATGARPGRVLRRQVLP